MHRNFQQTQKLEIKPEKLRTHGKRFTFQQPPQRAGSRGHQRGGEGAETTSIVDREDDAPPSRKWSAPAEPVHAVVDEELAVGRGWRVVTAVNEGARYGVPQEDVT